MSVLALDGPYADEKKLFLMQLFAVGIVAVAGLGVWLISFVAPNFFVYPYFYWGGWSAVAKFWPLFVWAIALNLVVMYLLSDNVPISAKHSRGLLGWETLTSTMAGIWEELGYRFFFICYAMIGIGVFNWMLSVGLGWLMVAGCLIASVVFWYQNEKMIAGLLLLGVALGWALVFFANPVYWVHQVIVYIVHFTTLFQMDPVLYGGHEKLFVFGAILANAWFRDGHKYQGPLGVINAWYGGMVLLYATVMYGLLTAIVVHALYDIVISVMRYLVQKTR